MRSIWRTLDRDLLRGIALILASVAAIGMSYGAIAVAYGFPVWFPVLTSVLVLAGASEFLFVGIVATGGNPIAAALAGLLVNARHLPYGLAVPDVIQPGWRRLLGTHVMNDEAVVVALSQTDPARKRAGYWACGGGILVCWPLGALLGALGGSLIHDTDAFGLDALFPAVILALVLPALRDRLTRRAALVGAAVALATAAFLPAGLPVLLALTGLLFGLPPKGSGEQQTGGLGGDPQEAEAAEAAEAAEEVCASEAAPEFAEADDQPRTAARVPMRDTKEAV